MVIMRENEFYAIFKINHFCSCFVEDPKETIKFKNYQSLQIVRTAQKRNSKTKIGS